MKSFSKFVLVCVVSLVFFGAMANVAKADEKGDAYSAYQDALAARTEAATNRKSIQDSITDIYGDPRVTSIGGQDSDDFRDNQGNVDLDLWWGASQWGDGAANEAAKDAASNYDTCIGYYNTWVDSGYTNYYAYDSYVYYAGKASDAAHLSSQITAEETLPAYGHAQGQVSNMWFILSKY